MRAIAPAAAGAQEQILDTFTLGNEDLSAILLALDTGRIGNLLHLPVRQIPPEVQGSLAAVERTGGAMLVKRLHLRLDALPGGAAFLVGAGLLWRQGLHAAVVRFRLGEIEDGDRRRGLRLAAGFRCVAVEMDELFHRALNKARSEE